MNASETLKRDKLNRVRAFYRTRSDALAEKCRKLNADIAELRRQETEIDAEIEHQQRHVTALPPTPIQRMLALQSLQEMASRKRQIQVQMRSTREEFELQRTALTTLMAKIESIEKLIERLTGSIALEMRKREQVNADERYLNTHFAKKSLT